MATTRMMEEMTWPEVADAARSNLPVILALGSTEQHGPHLPLNTDVLIPVAIATEASKQLELVVAPPVHFGAMSRPLSGGGETFPGTLSLRAGTLITTIHEVLSGLARAGFRRICLQNWHYENAAYLWEACDLTSVRHPDARMLIVENPFPQLTEAQLAEIFPKGFPGLGCRARFDHRDLAHVRHPTRSRSPRKDRRRRGETAPGLGRGSSPSRLHTDQRRAVASD
jgi:creatinine amidohydrolase